MSDVVISVEGVGKKYRLGTPSGTDRLSEMMVGLGRALWSAPRRWMRRFERAAGVASPGSAGSGDRGEFWALRDVSFQVRQGEAVGIIGRNGAGKSTLLKVLSRITAPTSGRFGVRGRVASLLEVGTGFHGELTGRENIFLSGTLLGMSRPEIRQRLDEIVAFAEVDQFLDTPMKRYSSGMQMRLGFAVAAHLQADILIVDEVLAVGDAQFQKKCLGKMDEVTRSGRTVLFVSHNVQAVRSLCTRGVLLGDGQTVMDDSVERVLPAYLASQREHSVRGIGLVDRLNRTSGDAMFEEVRASGPDGAVRWDFIEGDHVRLQLRCRVNQRVPGLGVYLAINTAAGDVITNFKSTVVPEALSAGSRVEVSLDLPQLGLRAGEYKLYICLGDPTCHRFYDVIDENVSLPWLIVRGTSADPHRDLGYVTLPGEWSVRSLARDVGLENEAP